ncbi:hypothetical protein AZE42_09649 [Rhizopogon vesiculosus]|uniref:Uncharacterized protein n=1 Tax=Rhizopogon vesiculosus TaxID=180088 RepID=A0A1J8R1N4_9AGAM|nr:hypothetical protein AZE42_09649 [Rhizopogon vesiculosus]
MILFSTSIGPNTTAVQILQDIDEALNTTLSICSSSKDLLTNAEQTKILNNHTRLSNARVQLTESTKCSKLSKLLDECESLKMKANRKCLKHREKEIRTILARSLASASSTPLVAAPKLSQNSSSVTARPVVLSQQSSGGSSHTLPTQTRTFAALAMKQHVRNFESECMTFNGNSVVRCPTMNINSPNAAGATNVYNGVRPVHNSPSPIPTAENWQRLSRTPTWRERCMTFEGGVADDPTLNIRSPGASGAFTQISSRSEELTI